jgi:gamma-glutamyltranspeptidase / glutathione hydrolase
MVASTHWLASAAGMAVLEAGGNAFDAAVATGFVLQVVEPHLNGPGGEVPVIGHSAATGETFVLDGQGTAPATATIERFNSLGVDLIPGNGLLAATVPAAFGTWMLLLARYGSLRLRDVMSYAIGYAADGHPLLGNASGTIDAMAQTFTEHWPTSAEIYLSGGVPAPGSRFANIVLAATYIRILAEAEAAGADREAQIEAARRAWYAGFVAEAIDDYVRRAEVMDVTGRRNRGLLAGADLAGSAELIHTVTEYAKLAFADREAWYGDPRTSDVPIAGLLDPEYVKARRALVGDRASGGLLPGSPDGRAAALPGYALAAFGLEVAHGLDTGHGGDLANGAAVPTAPGAGGTGDPTLASAALGPGDTCHLDVADRFGNLVSATPSPAATSRTNGRSASSSITWSSA